MSTLVILPNGCTERHDGLLGMIYEWSQTPNIQRAAIARGLCDEKTLLNAAAIARATGQGQETYLNEPACARVLLGFFLMDRSVRRAIAKHMSHSGRMRKGLAMASLGQLTDELRAMVEDPVGQA